MSPAGVFGGPLGAQPSRLSDDGLEALEGEEGWVDHVYLCPAGRLTIGYGHLVRPGETWPVRITKAQGREQLRADVTVAEATVVVAVEVPLAQHQFDALVMFAFNVGCAAFAASTLLRRLNEGDYDGAAEEFGRWVHGGGKALPVLVARRAREAARFRGESARA